MKSQADTLLKTEQYRGNYEDTPIMKYYEKLFSQQRRRLPAAKDWDCIPSFFVKEDGIGSLQNDD